MAGDCCGQTVAPAACQQTVSVQPVAELLAPGKRLHIKSPSVSHRQQAKLHRLGSCTVQAFSAQPRKTKSGTATSGWSIASECLSALPRGTYISIDAACCISAVSPGG